VEFDLPDFYSVKEWQILSAVECEFGVDFDQIKLAVI